jgi:2-hydroxy-3-keto-5-methylthiopentenyl-1-phosphate phosphatase
MNNRYRAIVSTDWNECLAPCGPFDYITFTYPELKPALNNIFKQYTGNHITLDDAMHQAGGFLPEPIRISQMDAYLEAAFQMYTGVANLIQWCQSRNILFMINTTGAAGYFQRALFKSLLPPLAVISAYPEPRYSKAATDPEQLRPLFETTDKPRHTEDVAHGLGVSLNRVIIIGDSGGDGPHFKWGRENGSLLIASMAKPSLQQYCLKEGIQPDSYFGYTYREGEDRDRAAEMHYDFMHLTERIEDVAG